MPSGEEKWCVNYTGIGLGYTCKEGIDYRTFNGGKELGLIRALPCLGHGPERCGFYEVSTPEQRAANEKKFRESMDRVAAIREAVVKDCPKNGGHGEIKCPCCGGTVRYSKASNGHVRARCSTEGCASWME